MPIRQANKLGAGTQLVFDTVRSVVTPTLEDRPPGPDAMAVHNALFSGGMYDALRAVTESGMVGYALRGVRRMSEIRRAASPNSL